MDKKIYNLKESSLGKVTFLDGTAFIAIAFTADNGERINEVLILASAEEAVKRFPSYIMELVFKHIQDKQSFHNSMLDWLVENWFDPGILTLQKELATQYGFPEIMNQDPIEWIKSEPEMVPLCLAHIAARFTNGYIKLPSSIRDMEFTCRFVKNVLAINFWEEGNPKSSEPIKKQDF
ncbi:hypothetical protein SHELI_v1c05930 [Spiroplasma helicoides]|uniref:Uncharacterized protein n=1 Tax=Spiroplasma helicoides TaxID=216938 RepID=A0A1B3SKT6_9MOLU|nr:hypothetical protein [Spiroplasma helicoides]AOG60544.1 hypothetical protein SHELI_v1c05930 [Spiroplasma helicoides]